MAYYKNRKNEELVSITPIFIVMHKPFIMGAKFFRYSLFYALCHFST